MSVTFPLGQSARSASILFVDDEPDVADLFRQHFRREARQGTYVMHFAASGQEALHRLSGEIRPAVFAVLSDINMPEMDGLQLLAEIKQRFPISKRDCENSVPASRQNVLTIKTYPL
jgi:CheY-like chemotaxis protein